MKPTMGLRKGNTVQRNITSYCIDEKELASTLYYQPNRGKFETLKKEKEKTTREIFSYFGLPPG